VDVHDRVLKKTVFGELYQLHWRVRRVSARKFHYLLTSSAIVWKTVSVLVRLVGMGIMD
jgi:hypothetical protein